MSDSQPYDFAEARAKAAAASRRQEAAEDLAREAAKEYAGAEQSYRLALAQRIVELRADGVAASTASDLARGDERVAGLKFRRDLAEGMRDVAYQALWRHTSDRKDMRGFLEWSMRAAFVAETTEPEYEPPIGARR